MIFFALLSFIILMTFLCFLIYTIMFVVVLIMRLFGFFD